jgi:hypothetical protein
MVLKYLTWRTELLKRERASIRYGQTRIMVFFTSVPFLRNFHWGAKQEKKEERKI